jgi:uncharacterized protein YgiM (DUF1202 family)
MKRLFLISLSALLLLTVAAAQSPAQATTATSSSTSAPTTGATKSVAPAATLSANSSSSANGISAKVVAWVLPLRANPSKRGAVLSKLKHNEVVAVLGANKFRTWLKVQTSTGTVGWVSAFYINLIGGRLRALPVVQ